MIRRPPRSTRVRSSAASDVYKRQVLDISSRFISGFCRCFQGGGEDVSAYLQAAASVQVGSCFSPGRSCQAGGRPELDFWARKIPASGRSISASGRRQAGVGFLGAGSSSLRPEHFGLRPEAGRSRIRSRILRPFYFGLRPFYFGLGLFYFGLEGQAGDSCWRRFGFLLKLSTAYPIE